VPGSSNLPTAESHGGPEHVGEAGGRETILPEDLQDPPGKVKAGLLEAQSRLGHCQPHHTAGSERWLIVVTSGAPSSTEERCKSTRCGTVK